MRPLRKAMALKRERWRALLPATSARAIAAADPARPTPAMTYGAGGSAGRAEWPGSNGEPTGLAVGRALQSQDQCY